MTSGVRRTTALLLAIVGCLLAVASVVAVWSRNQVLDTDRYLSSVAPLAADPIVQDEVAAKVTSAITTQLNARKAGVGDAVESLVHRQSLAVVRSNAFPGVWRTVNEIGHRDLVALLTGDESSKVAVKDGRLVLDLAPITAAARERLVAAGLTVAENLPTIPLTIDVADAHDVERARTAVTWLDRLAFVLPIAALATLAASVFVRGRVQRPLLRPAVMVAISMALLWVLVRLGGGVAASQVAATTASDEAVRTFYTHVTSLLRSGTVTVGLIAAAVAVGAFVWGLVRPQRASS